MTVTPSQPSSESTTPKPKRRWLQFNLRTLLVLTLVVGSGLGWIAYERRKNGRLQAYVEELESLGCEVFFEGTSLPKPFDWLFNRNPKIAACVQFQSNTINDTKLVHLKGLTNLKRLQFYDTAITDAGIVHLKGLTKLEDLYLVGTSITGSGLVHLKGLPNLRSLYLNDTAITDDGVVHLKSLANLKYLSLIDTPITDAGLKHLKGLTRLSQLHLDHIAITDAGIVYLKGLKNLSILCLNDTATWPTVSVAAKILTTST